MKKVFYGLAVAAIALSASAFTNVSYKSITDNFLVQRVTNEVTPYGSTGAPTGTCDGSAALQCIYTVTPAGKANIPSLSSLGQTFYTPTQIADYLSPAKQWLTVPSESSAALYVD